MLSDITRLRSPWTSTATYCQETKPQRSIRSVLKATARRGRVARMSFPFDELGDEQFEALALQVMRVWFGPGVQGFAPGRDGGRDARFNGTAAAFPSAASPWSGITIGQAKHTLSQNAHFGEAAFSGDGDSATLNIEIKRLKGLVDDSECKNYILFSNRRLTGGVNSDLIKRIAEGSGLDEANVHIVGIERLDELVWEDEGLLTRARINPLDGPLIVTSRELANVILAARDALQAAPSPDSAPTERVSFAEKNKANNMTEKYAAALKRRYLALARQFREFLAHPANEEHRKAYEAAVEEFSSKIVAYREDFHTFDKVMEHLFDLLLKRDVMLSKNAQLTRALVFYMYWNCDIGEHPVATTQ